MKRGNLKMPVSVVIIAMMIGGCGKQAGYEDAAPTQPTLQEIQETDFTLEEQEYQDNVLILYESEACTDERLAEILEKYHLTLLDEGDMIPYCTVQTEKSMTREELEGLADTITGEDGILSASLSYIYTIE
jgi:hypothetical protein